MIVKCSSTLTASGMLSWRNVRATLQPLPSRFSPLGTDRPDSFEFVVCWSRLVNPSHSPMRPLGFGTGHCRPSFAISLASASICRNVETSSSSWDARVFPFPGCGGCPSSATSMASLGLLRGRCTICPSAVTTVSESARVRRGAGQGKM